MDGTIGGTISLAVSGPESYENERILDINEIYGTGASLSDTA